MAKSVNWKLFSTKVITKNNKYNAPRKTFRHLGTLDTVQVKIEFNVPTAFEEPIEDYIADILARSKGLVNVTITNSSYVEQDDGYDASSEAETTMAGWTTALTEWESKAVKEYFEINSLVEKSMKEYFGDDFVGKIKQH